MRTADVTVNFVGQIFEKYSWFVNDLNDEINKQYEAMKLLGDRLARMCEIIDARSSDQNSSMLFRNSDRHLSSDDNERAGDGISSAENYVRTTPRIDQRR